MPTTRPRHTVTETPDIARALDEAARHWPEHSASRSALLARIIEEGRRAISMEHDAEVDRRAEAVRQTSGLLTDSYPAGYLDSLRDEWPARSFGASSITLAEVFVGPARTGRLSAAQTALHALDIREVSVGDDAAGRLAMLRAETGLKLPDCCVLLAAQDASAHAIATFDDRLRAQAQRLGLTTL